MASAGWDYKLEVNRRGEICLETKAMFPGGNGGTEPYYGVLTDDKFRAENITEQSKTELLETGRVHVQRVLSIASSHFGTLARRSALDFGCGVGRLVIPFAREFEQVTGVDVSLGMLEIARRNCQERDLSNVDFVHSDDRLSGVNRSYDFVHAYLVFQHIPVHRGKRLSASYLNA